MTDTARVLLTAGVLSASAITAFAWRLMRSDATDPERLIGQLRLAQLAALLLAGLGGIAIGLAVAAESIFAGNLDVGLGLALLVIAGLILRREPRDGLWLAAAGFLFHALVVIAHRPGWLPPDLIPRWYVIGSAIYDVYAAAICYWVQRR